MIVFNLRTKMPGKLVIATFCLTASVLALATTTSCRGDDGTVITRAEDLLKLSHDQAISARPVHIIGTVIGRAEQEQHAALVHDGKACVYVRSDTLPAHEWRRGDQVEISGSSNPGGFAPIVVANSIHILGTATIPTPISVSYEELLFGGFNGQWIEMRGIVRSCIWKPELDPPRTELMVATGGQQIYVRVVNSELPSTEWVDSDVRVRGICFHQYTDNRQAIIPRLWVPENEPLIKEWGPPSPLFEGEPQSILSLLQFSAKGSYGHRLLMEGEVVHFQKGSHIYVQDSSQCIRVNTAQDIQLHPGDRIRVLGFPSKMEHAPYLEDATCIKRGVVDRPIQPIPLKTLGDAFPYDPGLVRLTATVVAPVLHREGWALSVENDGYKFPLVFPANLKTAPSAELEPGTRIEVTGISLDTGYWMQDGGSAFSSSFRILVRSAGDIVIVGRPPWWTPQRLYLLLVSLVAASLAALAIVWLQARARFRRQQMSRRLAEGEFAAILNERNRMAREIHDTVAQDLSAITAQLEVARSKLGKANDAALVHINMAREAACSSLQEARRSIWNMRSQVLEDRDLADALTCLLEQTTRGTTTRGLSRVIGGIRRLPSAIENHLLRIGQQAIHNAMLHGHPATLELAVEFSDSHIKLAVKDDGCGFDQEAGDRDLSDHFGLAGMRERIQQCGGSLRITTHPGTGTEIFCEIPIGNDLVSP